MTSERAGPVTYPSIKLVEKLRLGIGKANWDDFANCGDCDEPMVFFPGEDEPEKEEIAKAICGECLVIDECLNSAIETNQKKGIWGGMTRKERNKIRRERMAEARANK